MLSEYKQHESDSNSCEFMKNYVDIAHIHHRVMSHSPHSIITPRVRHKMKFKIVQNVISI